MSESSQITVELRSYKSGKDYWVSIDGYGEQYGTSGTFTVPMGHYGWARGSDHHYAAQATQFTAVSASQTVYVYMNDT